MKSFREHINESENTYQPPKAAQEEAKWGLEMRDKHGRGGTDVGVARARDLSNGKSVSLDTVKRMHSFFSRHAVDKQADGWNPGEDGYPSAGRISHALWGGSAAKKWVANHLSESLDEQTVTWDWGNGTAKGKVVGKHTNKISKTIKGTQVTKNGTDDNPAYEIEQEDSTKVLKLKSELN